MKHETVETCFDTETGGLNPLEHSLLSIAFVTKTRSISFYVREDPIVAMPSALAVNKIDIKHVERVGISPEEAVERISDFFDQISDGVWSRIKLIGHNVSFDIAYLQRLWRLAKKPFPPYLTHRTVDTSTLLWTLAAAGLIPEEAGASYAGFDHFGVEWMGAAHTALADAQATLKLYFQIVKALETYRSQPIPAIPMPSRPKTASGLPTSPLKIVFDDE